MSLIIHRGVVTYNDRVSQPWVSSLELITSLKKFKIIEFDKTINKLVYKNANISDKTGLSENTIIIMINTLHDNPDIQKFARKKCL